MPFTLTPYAVNVFKITLHTGERAGWPIAADEGLLLLSLSLSR